MSFFGLWDPKVPDPVVSYDDEGRLESIEMLRPSDFHNHFRVGSLRSAVTPEVSWPYRYVLAMPNTSPHIYTLADARRYKEEVMDILAGANIKTTELVMTIYLAHSTTVETIQELVDCGMKIAVKAYPPGGTTNSDEAAPLIDKLDVIQAMAAYKIPLLIHGELTHLPHTGVEVPHQDRENRFYSVVYPEFRQRFPMLRICLEHITTAQAVAIVKADPRGLTACTITPQHGLLNDSAFAEAWGGNEARCMPYLKGIRDQIAIRSFMTSGDPRVILGTDCAPHLSRNKQGSFEEAACGCYTPHALAMYAKIFYECNALDSRFTRFACTNGPDWWGLPRPDRTDTIRLQAVPGPGIPEPTPVPAENDVVVPLGWTQNVADRLSIGIEAVRIGN